jgi:hypothetical protein
VKKRVLTTLRAWDNAWHRGLRGVWRRVLFDGETAMHFSMFETLCGCLNLDPRIQSCFTCSWNGGLKTPLQSVARLLKSEAQHFVPFSRAQWQKWDLYVSSCFDVPWFARSVPWVDTFHGVGEKWADDGTRLYMCHPLAVRYDRLLCPNQRLAAQFEARPSFLKTPDSLRLTGLAKSDTLVWFNTPEIRSALKKALPLRAGKPVVLFAPTWGREGLLARHADAVMDACLESGVNLIVKLHSCSYLPDAQFSGGVDWGKRMDEMALQRGFLHLPHANLSALMLLADAMVADFGSAAVEFCLLDRPLLFFRIEEQGARIGGDRFQFETLCAAGNNIATMEQLRTALRRILQGEDDAAEARKSLAQTFFFAAGQATFNCLKEMYALMDLECPVGLVETYQVALRRDILAEPAAFLGIGN